MVIIFEIKVHHYKSYNTKRSFLKKWQKKERTRKYIYNWLEIKENLQIGVKHQKVLIHGIF